MLLFVQTMFLKVYNLKI